MSFACHIWEFPAPADSAEVDLIREAYRNVQQAPNPRFIELIKRLTARHPDLMDLETDEELETAVWTGGPLDLGTDQPVWGLGIVSDYLDTVYPFVCETANALGLNVYNDVDGATHRPDGMVVEFSQKDAAQKLSSDGLDLSKLRELLAGTFAAVAAANGFKRVGYNYVRGIEGGWQALATRVKEVEGDVVADVSIDIYFYEVMRICHELDPERLAGNSSGRAFNLSIYEFFDDPRSRLILREPGDFLPVARKLAPLVKDRLMPAADECRTLKGLDGLMNTGRTKLRLYPLDHLIVSRLVCNPDYDDLYRRMRKDGAIGDDLHFWLGATRQRLAMWLPCDHETVIVSSFGPGGGKVGIQRGTEK